MRESQKVDCGSLISFYQERVPCERDGCAYTEVHDGK